MDKEINKLIDAIAADFESFATNCEFTEGIDYAKQCKDSIKVKTGKKYIKILRENMVWGFIVNVDNDKKFKYGDILKAAGWATPARNKARGNVFEEYTIRWTGPLYL